jgi:hypothetical protein
MSDIFVSYVAEDTAVAEAIAAGLEAAGYTTWYYTRDSKPGTSHLRQTGLAIEAARATVLVLSPNLVGKLKEVRLEVEGTHEWGKPFIPVLAGLTWPEFKEKLPDIKQVLGAAVAVTLIADRFEELNSRILAGLKLMGIEPHVLAPTSTIVVRYPYPLAAAYSRRMLRGVSLEQSFQLHQGLGDLAEVIARFMGAIAVAEYRGDSTTPGNDDPEIESELSRWPAGIGSWVSLLHSILGLYGEGARPPLASLHAFLFQKKLRQDRVSAAIAGLGTWLRAGPQRKAPFSHEDLLDHLAEYQKLPGGWGARGAVLAPQDYQQRAELLGAALEQTLSDLDVLADLRLVGVQGAADARGEVGGQTIYHGVGADLVARPEPVYSARPLQNDHVYLCRPCPGGHEAALDLYPLVACQTCAACRRVTMFFLDRDARRAFEWVGCGCDHRQGLTSDQSEDAEDFCDLARWRGRGSLGMELPYVSALRQVLRGGSVQPDERQKLDFLARMLRIDPARAAGLEARVLAEIEPPQPEPSTPPEAIPLPADVAEEVREAGGGEAPPADVQACAPTQMVECWTDEIPGVVVVAAYGQPLRALAAGATGEVHLFDEHHRLVIRDRVPGRPYRALALPDRVLLSTWEGHLLCFGIDALAWQADLGSPVSALGGNCQQGQILAGTWSGLVGAFDLDGHERWRQRFADGVSTLAAARESRAVAVGTYGGHLALLGEEGQIRWLRDLGEPVSHVAIDGHGRFVVVAVRPGLLLRIRVEDQATEWQEALDGSVVDVALTPDERRLVVACAGGRCRVYPLDGGVHRPAEYSIPGSSSVAVSPLFADGRFLMARSDLGLVILDTRTRTLSHETKVTPDCAATSADGRFMVAGAGDALTLYRLGRPRLHVELSPKGSLARDQYARLELTLRNSGERPARDLELTLEGPVEFVAADLPSEVRPHGTVVVSNQSLKPKASGALPVVIRLRYRDDLSFEHEDQQRTVLDVAG